MRTFNLLVCSATLVAVATFTGCEGEGRYRVTWSFSDGEISSASDCSRRGVERVVITLENPDTGGIVKSTAHPCRDGVSPKLRVSPGTYRARVQAFGGSDQPFIDPETGGEALVEYVAELRVSDGKLTEAEVVFTPNPQCADGVDNDADGLVDAADPGCRDDKTGEYVPTRDNEEDEAQDATLAVTWSIHGSTPCANLQPEGASHASLSVDGLEVGLYPCADGAGEVIIAAGDHTVALQLLDASGLALATAPSQDASLVQDLTTDVAFEFTLDTFDPPQTGELSFSLSWISPGGSCGDASPLVAEQRLWLRDLGGITVDATTLAGAAVDDTAAAVSMCIDASTVQGLTAYIPAGDYLLDIAGLTAAGAECWDASDIAVTVPIGPAAGPYNLVVPQVDATGLCAP